MNSENEQKLIEKCKSGDSTAFGPLIKVYHRQLLSYLFRLCGNRNRAEELFQETLIKVWKGMNTYSEQQKFFSWLFTIAHNVAMNNLRLRKRDSILVDINPDVLKSPNDPHKELVAIEQNAIVEKAIDELPVKQKRVLLLRMYGEMSFKDIAALTCEPVNTVISHMHYSVKRLRTLLGKYNG